MFKSILVPVDGSPPSQVACQHALDFAKRFGGRLTGLHVVDSKILEAPYLTDLAGMTGAVPFTGILADVRQTLEKRGGDVLAAFKTAVAQQGGEAETVLQTGLIPQTIAQASMSHDLVCMGRKSGDPAWGGNLLGSNLESTLRLLHMPVLLAGESFRPIQRILVAYDGSVFANAALRVAIQLIETTPAECLLLAIAPHEDQAEPLLADGRQLIEAHGIPYHQVLRAGDPREQIVRVAAEQGADLVVMGAFGHSRLHQVLLGSTTEAVLRTCHLPLLIARA